jgi:N utilization substance protein B
VASARRKARAIALQALYEIDCARHEAGETVNRLLEEAGLSGENAAFAWELVSGVVRNRAEIDGHIQALAAAWPVEQIAKVDRNIIRLAIFEILLDNKVPVKVAINEAVELAKIFGSESSAKFVNGVLGSVSELARR